MTSAHGRLASRLADAALLRGSFTLRSGKTSSYYLDKYRFTTRPEILRELAVMFAAKIGEIERGSGPSGGTGGGRIDRLAGAELGGIPLVTVASLETGKPCVFVRNAKKDYGTAKQVEGALERGDRVVLIEDIATTGGQAIEAAGSLRDCGAEVVGVIATIDREEGAAEAMARAGLAYWSLFTKGDLGIE